MMDFLDSSPLTDDGDETIVLALLRRDLIEKGRSEATVTAYTAAGKRFEKFVRGQEPPIDPELLELDEAIELAHRFREKVLEKLGRPSLYAYESALASYLEALDCSFTRERLTFVSGSPTSEEIMKMVGRRPPSTALTNDELYSLRRRSARRPPWLRTVIELGVTGLSWNEIMTVTNSQVSHFGNQPRITLLERTIPIYERQSAEWLDTNEKRIYPSTAKRGRPISLRLTKQKLAAALTESRPGFGPGQGLRALHKTGAIRLLRRGKSPDEIARLYRRTGVPEQSTRERARTHPGESFWEGGVGFRSRAGT